MTILIHYLLQKVKLIRDHIVKEIEKINPDLLICYGSSLIKSSLAEKL